MGHLNWLAIIIASLSAFVVGYFWYGPALFGKTWQRENGLSDETLKQSNMAQIYGSALGLTFMFCVLLSLNMITSDKSGMADGIKHGIYIGAGFVGTSLGINYLFARKSFRLFLIDAGYFVLTAAIMGAIIGSWGY